MKIDSQGKCVLHGLKVEVPEGEGTVLDIGTLTLIRVTLQYGSDRPQVELAVLVSAREGNDSC